MALPNCRTCENWIPYGTDKKQGECHLPPRFVVQKGKVSEVVWPLTYGDRPGCLEHTDIESEVVQQTKRRGKT